jgi:hypothetical protein
LEFLRKHILSDCSVDPKTLSSAIIINTLVTDKPAGSQKVVVMMVDQEITSSHRNHGQQS